MTSPDLGSAFTACPDDTPKLLQVWFSAPITCACPTVAENWGAVFAEKMLPPPLIPGTEGPGTRPFPSVMIPGIRLAKNPEQRPLTCFLSSCLRYDFS
jgi:hypothetical protein